MVAFDGKYVLVENKNFVDFLVKSGIPADAAAKADATRPTLTVKKSGDTISVTVTGSSTSDGSINLVLNKEVDEVLSGISLKSVATLDGNVITVTSKSPTSGQSGKRTYTFSDSGVEVMLFAENGAQATRIYKRA